MSKGKKWGQVWNLWEENRVFSIEFHDHLSTVCVVSIWRTTEHGVFGILTDRTNIKDASTTNVMWHFKLLRAIESNVSHSSTMLL